MRSRSYSSANVLAGAGSLASKEFIDEENSHKPGFSRASDDVSHRAESLPLPTLHALVEDTLAPQTAAGHHRRRSSLSVLASHTPNPLPMGSVAAALLTANTPTPFSRGISLHHRRSTSVLQLSLLPSGTRTTAPSSAHGSGQVSRVGSVISTVSMEGGETESNSIETSVADRSAWGHSAGRPQLL